MKKINELTFTSENANSFEIHPSTVKDLTFQSDELVYPYGNIENRRLCKKMLKQMEKINGRILRT
jgi:hypothetical protein